MRGIEHTAGYWFPWAINGSDFEQAELWDEETYYAAPDGSMTPSNSTASATPVVGPRTAWWLGLTLQEMAFAWWRIDRWRQKFIDTITLATPQASISADFSAADQLTFSRLTATTTLPFFRSDRRALIRAVRSVSGDYQAGLPKFAETPGALMTVASTTTGGVHGPAGAVAPGFSASVGNPSVISWETPTSNFYSGLGTPPPDTLTLDGAYRWAQRGVRYCPADGQYYICMPTLSMRVRAHSQGYPERRTVVAKVPVALGLDGFYRHAYDESGTGRVWAYGTFEYKVVDSNTVMGKSVLYAQTPPVTYGFQNGVPSFLPSSSYFLPSQTTGESTIPYTFAKGTAFEKTLQVPLFQRLQNLNMPRSWPATTVIYTEPTSNYLYWDLDEGATAEAVPTNVGWGIYNANGSAFSWDQLGLPGAGSPAISQDVPGWLDAISNLDIAIELTPEAYYGYGGVYSTTTGAYIEPA